MFYGVVSSRNCMIGKSPYTVIQTIGRLIRKHVAKNKAIIIDIRDDFECDVKYTPTHLKKTYSMSHSEVRYEIYVNEKYEISHNKHKTITI
jgi:superfamily II DNA or RNA helicase